MIAYQYDSSGYYVGEVEDFGLLPNNATHKEPRIKKGFIPYWTGYIWEQVENHVGEEGYLNGEPFVIKEYGEYPDGWSTMAPILSTYEEEKVNIESKYEETIKTIKDDLLSAILIDATSTIESLKAEYKSTIAERTQELKDLEEKTRVLQANVEILRT